MHPDWQGRRADGKKFKRMASITAMMQEQTSVLGMVDRALLRVLWYECAGKVYVSRTGQYYATCWHTCRKLAGLVGCSTRSVYRALSTLTDAGFVVTVPRDDGSNLIALPLLGMTESQGGYDTESHGGDTQSQQCDTESQGSDTQSIPIRKNSLLEQRKEQSTEQTGGSTELIGRQCWELVSVYLARPGVYGHERAFHQACKREVEEGRSKSLSDAADKIVNVARGHDAWLTANHQLGRDYPNDKLVRRVVRWLDEACYLELPERVFAHVDRKALPDDRPDSRAELRKQIQQAKDRRAGRVA